MRTRIAVLCLTLGALLPGTAAAHAAPHYRLTIASTPNPIVAGDGVLIYGQLSGPTPGNQTIRLWHRILPAPGYSVISTTTTSPTGYYSFTRADGIVLTNRDWFVTGPNRSHSHVVREKVQAQVTLGSPSATNGTVTATTGEPVSFTGTVSPAHLGQPVRLQDQSSITGTGWGSIARGRTTASSTFTIVKRFAHPGTYTVRAAFGPDPRNILSTSDELTVVVQQRENPTFTINTSAPVITAGQSATLSGNLFAPGSTTAPLSGVTVTLFGHTDGQSFHPIAHMTTGADGGYRFTVSPLHNTSYIVRAGARHTANVYEGVADTITATPNPTTVTIGSPFSVTGAVTPPHVGHLLYLQVQTPGGGWADLASGRVGPNGTYSLAGSFGQAGTFTVRVRIPGGPYNVGAASAPFTITVSGLPPYSLLPVAS